MNREDVVACLTKAEGNVQLTNGVGPAHAAAYALTAIAQALIAIGWIMSGECGEE